jgi:hypothetical protein
LPGVLKSEHAFVSHDRYDGLFAEFGERGEVAGGNGLFGEQESGIAKFPETVSSLLNGPAAVGVDGDGNVRPANFPNRTHTSDVSFRVQPGLDFDAGDTLGKVLFRHAARTRNITSPHDQLDANLVPDAAAQQSPDGGIDSLARDIPAGHFQSGFGKWILLDKEVHRASHAGDVAGITADQCRSKIFANQGEYCALSFPGPKG